MPGVERYIPHTYSFNDLSRGWLMLNNHNASHFQACECCIRACVNISECVCWTNQSVTHLGTYVLFWPLLRFRHTHPSSDFLWLRTKGAIWVVSALNISNEEQHCEHGVFLLKCLSHVLKTNDKKRTNSNGK